MFFLIFQYISHVAYLVPSIWLSTICGNTTILWLFFNILRHLPLNWFGLRARWEFTFFRWFTTKATKVFGPILWSAPMAVASTVAAASSLMEARVCGVEGACYTFSDISECSLHFTCFTSFHFQKKIKQLRNRHVWHKILFSFIVHMVGSGPGSIRLFLILWIFSIAPGQHWRLVSSLFLSAGAVQLVPGDDTSTQHNQLVKSLGDLYFGVNYTYI